MDDLELQKVIVLYESLKDLDAVMLVAWRRRQWIECSFEKLMNNWTDIMLFLKLD